MSVEYQLDTLTGLVGLLLYPCQKANQRLPPRECLDEPAILKMPDGWNHVQARPVESLVQVKISGDVNPVGYALGRTLRNSGTSLRLRFKEQRVEESETQIKVKTTLQDASGLEVAHELIWPLAAPFVRIKSTFINRSEKKVCLELLSSFSLGGLTPFHSADAPERLWAHRIHSSWSAEGRLESVPIERLHLERSWQGHAVNTERFGQIGSMPTRGYFPFAAVEDRVAGVTWGAQLAWGGSWQMEFYRQNDALSLSGGLADREFGHWTKDIDAGETFQSPEAVVSVVSGDVEEVCYSLIQAQIAAADKQPAVEGTLPIICNEFCSSWGNPTQENLGQLARMLEGSPVKYLVMDAGWYGHPGKNWFRAQGDWEPSALRFPDGLKAVCDSIRAAGLIPGIWFEFEVAGGDSKAFQRHEYQLKSQDEVITVADRHFWDFRQPWVIEYLSKKVIHLIKTTGMGYLKVDYNETIGIGVDGAESPGEGLRQHIEAVGFFFDLIRAELPDLVIENCSSGGHRLEPSFLARTSMSSFSDAHETLEAPLIAANLHRVMLPRQEQIWVVLRKEDSPQRLYYSLCTGFLGRLCLSGDLTELPTRSWSLVSHAFSFYEKIKPLLKEGKSFIYRSEILSYRQPKGWQVVLRLSASGDQAFAVIHAFAGCPRQTEVPLPPGNWRVVDQLAENPIETMISPCKLGITLAAEFSAMVILLVKDN